MLNLRGEQGSAKSTAATMLRRLTDPASASSRGEPKGDDELRAAVVNNWVVVLDNLSHVPGAGGKPGTLEAFNDEASMLITRTIAQLNPGEAGGHPDLLPLWLGKLEDGGTFEIMVKVTAPQLPEPDYHRLLLVVRMGELLIPPALAA